MRDVGGWYENGERAGTQIDLQESCVTKRATHLGPAEICSQDNWKLAMGASPEGTWREGPVNLQAVQDMAEEEGRKRK